jgi:signal transduction histidine kinase
MGRKLRVLVLEDQVDDFDVVMWSLRRSDYDVEAKRVQTEESMRAALATATWDLIISDWSMPPFSAPRALEILRELRLDLPVIIVSGTIGEETAVEALRNGAHDFLLKDRLGRLAVAIDRELGEAERRRERAKLREQLMISDRMVSVGILAAGVAHEINNPLAAVLVNLELAIADLEAAGAAPEILEEVRDARDAATRVRDIVSDLKIFSRHETAHHQAVDAVEVMQSTLRMASNEIRHRAKLVIDYRTVPPVLADASRLGQVFLNLVVNAAQALPEGRAHHNQIRISIATAGERVRVEVADTGPGIAPEIMDRLFTPFVTTKPVGVGTGLGLSICHRIVTGFGGEITVDSKPGAGTTFVVLLPIARNVSPTHDQPIPSNVPARRRGNVLIVDDDPMIVRAIQRVTGGDHEVEAVSRGVDALELVRGGKRFDVIVCDLMMPEMTGMELHEQLRATAPDQVSSIIFLTGGAFTSGAQAFLENVENLYIEKPFDPMNLRAIINDRIR